MNGKPNIKRWKIVGIDTNVFIYYYYDHPEFAPSANRVFYLLSRNRLKGVTSLLTLIELLAFKALAIELEKIEEAFLKTPNLNIPLVDQEIALKAAKIRREYGFRLPDAVQLATALVGKAQVFITNDDHLKSYKELKVISLAELK